MKDAFDRLTSRMDTVEERISELEDIATNSSKTRKQRATVTLKCKHQFKI